MAAKNIFRKIDLLHIPSVALLVGYLVYWVELYLLNKNTACTSLLAWFLLIFIVVSALCVNFSKVTLLARTLIKQFMCLTKTQKLISVFVLILVMFVFVIAVKALTYPVHLQQEGDTLNYHITMPRQHLLRNSFKHISWSHGDLFVNPISYALAPYWLIKESPSKLVHIFFIFGIFALPLRMLFRNNKEKKIFPCILLLAALLGTHALGIQVSTAMLDVIIAYLFFAFLDSVYSKRYCAAAFELCFLFWAKPFMPILLGFIFVVLFTVKFFAKNSVILHGQFLVAFENRKFLLSFLCFSFVLAGPFVVKSFLYTGSPLYPFLADKIPPILSEGATRDSLIQSAKIHMGAKDAYGYGRNIIVFLKHVWLLAVPEKGVNNAYDYPAGLSVLLLLPLFLFSFIKELFSKKINFLSLFVVLYWGLWWLGSQQTRFLFIPLILIYLLVLSDKKKKKCYILALCLLVGSMFTTLSVFRSNLADFKSTQLSYLRDNEKYYIDLNKKYRNTNKTIEIPKNRTDAAYACFPIFIRGPKYPWILEVVEENNY